jgi:hypothetical protein
MAPCRASINAHTRRRIFARVVAIRSRWSAPITSSARHNVGSDATGRPVQLPLIAQRGQVRQHPTAISDAHRGVDQYTTPVMHRGVPAPAQRLRQRPGQPAVVGE